MFVSVFVCVYVHARAHGRVHVPLFRYLWMPKESADLQELELYAVVKQEPNLDPLQE